MCRARPSVSATEYSLQVDPLSLSGVFEFKGDVFSSSLSSFKGSGFSTQGRVFLFHLRTVDERDSTKRPEQPLLHMDLNEFVLHLLQREVIFVKSTDLCICAPPERED